MAKTNKLEEADRLLDMIYAQREDMSAVDGATLEDELKYFRTLELYLVALGILPCRWTEMNLGMD